jgi:O-antigen/teichoic acid export membrane protein
LTAQAFWLIVARTAGFALNLALPIAMVRIFTVAEFGVYKLAFVFISTAQVLLSFNFGISAFYFLARRPEKSRAIILNQVLFHLFIGVTALALLAAWPDSLRILLSSQALTPMAAVVGAVICVSLFSMPLEQVATANGDVAYSTSFIVGAQATKVTALLSAALLFRTVEAVLYGAFIHGVLQCCAQLWYFERRYPGYWRELDRHLAWEQVKYVIPSAITGAVYAFQADLHSYLVAGRFSSAEYALYAVGTSQVPLVGILRDAINTIMLPRVSKLQQEGNKAEILRLLLTAWRKSAAAMLPVFACLMVLRHEFIVVLYRQAYAASSPIFALNLTLLLFGVLVTDAVIRAHVTLQMWMIRIRIVSLAIQVAVSLLAMPVFGMIGALIGVLAGFAFERAVSMQAVLRLLKFRWSDMRGVAGIGGFAVASAAAGGAAQAALWLLSSQPPIVRLLVCGALFSIVYCAAVLYLNLLEEEEIGLLKRYSHQLLKRIGA